MSAHLTMDALIALRDDDRSEPGTGSAMQHLAACLACQAELHRLHQRTARLRALPLLAPNRNAFQVVQQRIVAERRHRRSRTIGTLGLAAAAALIIAVIGRDLVHPARLDAEQQLQTEITTSQQLEQTLHAWNPDERVMDGRTAMVVIQLEDRIANLDAELASSRKLEGRARVRRELELWHQRVGLMNALVDVHLTKASNVGL